jgi:hypothetical protein
VRAYDQRNPHGLRVRPAESSLTQEFVFETNSLEALARVLMVTVPMLFWDRPLVVSDGDAHRSVEPESYPSYSAAYFLGRRDPQKMKIHRFLCSISSEWGYSGSGARRMLPGEAVRAAMDIAGQKRGGAGSGYEPFDNCDGGVTTGYRAQWSTRIGNRLDIFGCNIYVSK